MSPFSPAAHRPPALSRTWTGALLRRARPAALLLGTIGGIGTALGAGTADAPAEPGTLAGPAGDLTRPAPGPGRASIGRGRSAGSPACRSSPPPVPRSRRLRDCRSG